MKTKLNISLVQKSETISVQTKGACSTLGIVNVIASLMDELIKLGISTNEILEKVRECRQQQEGLKRYE